MRTSLAPVVEDVVAFGVGSAVRADVGADRATGPTLLVMNAPSWALNVFSLRTQFPGAKSALCRSRMSTPLEPGAVTSMRSDVQRSEKWWRWYAPVTRLFSGFGPSWSL